MYPKEESLGYQDLKNLVQDNVTIHTKKLTFLLRKQTLTSQPQK